MLPMWPVIIGLFQRRLVRVISLPIGIVFGTIGYYVEGLISDRHTPSAGSIEDKRAERLLGEELHSDPTEVDSLREKKFVPKTIFERNIAPSLQEVS